jgi:hypothetical protein
MMFSVCPLMIAFKSMRHPFDSSRFLYSDINAQNSIPAMRLPNGNVEHGAVRDSWGDGYAKGLLDPDHPLSLAVWTQKAPIAAAALAERAQAWDRNGDWKYASLCRFLKGEEYFHAQDVLSSFADKWDAGKAA